MPRELQSYYGRSYLHSHLLQNRFLATPWSYAPTPFSQPPSASPAIRVTLAAPSVRAGQRSRNLLPIQREWTLQHHLETWGQTGRFPPFLRGNVPSVPEFLAS